MRSEDMRTRRRPLRLRRTGNDRCTEDLYRQPIQLTLEATVPDNVPFVWPAIDSLPHFERLDSGKIDTTVAAGGAVLPAKIDHYQLGLGILGHTASGVRVGGQESFY